AATYTLKYTFYRFGQAAVTLAAAGSGTSFTTTVVPASSTFAAGEWGWTAYVEKGSGGSLERYTLADGTVKVKPSLIGAAATTDLRSHAQKMLDGITAVLEGRASHAESSLLINGREVQYIKPADLERWKESYQRQVNAETGKAGSTIVRIQFGEAT
ncbi:MAG: hypothetical protein D4R80_06535, partial [Deltaproteobacteria bacterium]